LEVRRAAGDDHRLLEHLAAIALVAEEANAKLEVGLVAIASGWLTL